MGRMILRNPYIPRSALSSKHRSFGSRSLRIPEQSDHSGAVSYRAKRTTRDNPAAWPYPVGLFRRKGETNGEYEGIHA